MRALVWSTLALGVLAALASCKKTSETSTTPLTTLCDPGENIFCRCPGGEPGTKTCKNDGNSFEPCETYDGPCPAISTSTSSGTGGATGSTTSTTTTTQTGGAPPGTLMLVAGTANLWASWSAGKAWSTGSVGAKVDRAALAALPAGNVGVAVRRADGELVWSQGVPGAALSPPVTVGAASLGAPALVGQGSGAMLVWLGADHKHAWASVSGGSVGAASAIPGGTAGDQAFGPSPPAAAGYGGGGVFAAYVGDDGKPYLVDWPGGGAGFGVSTALAPAAPAQKAIGPVALGEEMNDVYYVRQSDGRICLNRVSGASQVGVEVLHDLAITGETPSAARASNGEVVVAWHGFDDGGIYFLRGKPGAWGAPVTVDLPAQATTAPVVTAGLSGADAELVYLRGGKLVHARIAAGKVIATEEVSQVSGATSLAAVALP